MVAFWIVTIVIALVTTVTAGLLTLGKGAPGRRQKVAGWLRRARHHRWIRTKQERAKRAAMVAQTPAGILKAQRREQPLGRFALRVREPGDERRTRKVASKVGSKVRREIARQTRAAKRSEATAVQEKPKLVAAVKQAEANAAQADEPRLYEGGWIAPREYLDRMNSPESRRKAAEAWKWMAVRSPQPGRCNKVTQDGTLCRNPAGCSIDHKGAQGEKARKRAAR